MKRFAIIIVTTCLGLFGCDKVVRNILPNNYPCVNGNTDLCISGLCTNGICEGRAYNAACDDSNQCGSGNCSGGVCGYPVCEAACTDLANGLSAKSSTQCFSRKPLVAGHCVGKAVGETCINNYECATAWCDSSTGLCASDTKTKLMAGSVCTAAAQCYSGTCTGGYCIGLPGGSKYPVEVVNGVLQQKLFYCASTNQLPGADGICAFPMLGCATCVSRSTTCSPTCESYQNCSGTTCVDKVGTVPNGAICTRDTQCITGFCNGGFCDTPYTPPPPTVTFDYSVVPAVSSVSVVAGNSVSITFNSTTLSGGPQTVNIGTVSVSPTGPTVSPSVSSFTSGDSFTVSFLSSTTGSYTVTLPTSSGTLNRSRSVTVFVTPPNSGDFSISAPASITVPQGGSGTFTVSISALSGAPTVNFGAAYATSISTGVACGFTPGATTAPGSTTVTVNVGSSVAAGTYTDALTITGTGPTSSHEAKVNLTVTATSTTNKVHPATCTSNTECRSGSCYNGVCAPDQFKMCELYAGTNVNVYGVTGEFRSVRMDVGGCWVSDPSKNDAAATESGTLNYLCQQFTYWWTTSHQCTLVGSTGQYGVVWNNGMTTTP